MEIKQALVLTEPHQENRREGKREGKQDRERGRRGLVPQRDPNEGKYMKQNGPCSSFSQQERQEVFIVISSHWEVMDAEAPTH